MITLTVANLKAHLNITADETHDDAVIEAYGDAAEEWAASFAGLDLAELDPIPETLKQAVHMTVAHWYENREAVAFGVTSEMVPVGVFDLLRSLRTWAF